MARIRTNIDTASNVDIIYLSEISQAAPIHITNPYSIPSSFFNVLFFWAVFKRAVNRQRHAHDVLLWSQ